MLKDAFDPEEETERDWDIELRDDVKTETEAKYGKVSEIFVVKESQVGSRLLFRRSLRPKLIRFFLAPRTGRDLHSFRDRRLGDPSCRWSQRKVVWRASDFSIAHDRQFV
jgi:hypothetical protein